MRECPQAIGAGEIVSSFFPEKIIDNLCSTLPVSSRVMVFNDFIAWSCSRRLMSNRFCPCESGRHAHSIKQSGIIIRPLAKKALKRNLFMVFSCLWLMYLFILQSVVQKQLNKLCRKYTNNNRYFQIFNIFFRNKMRTLATANCTL